MTDRSTKMEKLNLKKEKFDNVISKSMPKIGSQCLKKETVQKLILC